MATIQSKLVLLLPRGSKALGISTMEIGSPARPFVDVREFYANGEMQNVGTADERPIYKPSKKGVCFPISVLEEGLIEALKDIAEKHTNRKGQPDKKEAGKTKPPGAVDSESTYAGAHGTPVKEKAKRKGKGKEKDDGKK